MKKKEKEAVVQKIIENYGKLDVTLLERGITIELIAERYLESNPTKEQLRLLYLEYTNGHKKLTPEQLEDLCSRKFFHETKATLTYKLPVKIHRTGNGRTVYTTYDVYFRKEDGEFHLVLEQIKFQTEWDGLSVLVELYRAMYQ